ncbi:DUF1127 domain-containing protein [Salipiger mucosus]|uniref:YjiS-like domain-containing protein n=1 Tax=Salipiger mucosus DSM 16094 TaxID=1123237 RepID=S9QVH1_9RHOB|nr:DUF1127 domain-containing protein [Salipiger mucosus]EPX83552.1 hypothetical protein Salmuc_02160 [Salipiger mucosus DSM 16094]
MAAIDTQTTPLNGMRDRVQALLETWKVRRAQRAEYNRVRRELSGMTDRDLADIGIPRVSIDDIAYEAAYRM